MGEESDDEEESTDVDGMNEDGMIAWMDTSPEEYLDFEYDEEEGTNEIVHKPSSNNNVNGYDVYENENINVLDEEEMVKKQMKVNTVKEEAEEMKNRVKEEFNLKMNALKEEEKIQMR